MLMHTQKDTDFLYSTEKVVLKGMPVKNKDTIANN